MTEDKWPWQEEDPQEYARQMKEQTESIRDEIGGLIRAIVDSTPGAAWPDEKAPVIGQLGFSSSFLNCRTQALYKLKDAYDLLEMGLKNY